MNILSGLILVLSLMILMFFGPEYFETLFKRPRRFKKISNNRRQALTRDWPI
jgi:hypothetical protein